MKKTQCFATFLPFRAPGSSFFGDFLFLIFFLLLFSDSSHLCFSSVHIVGSLTSKLPSITIMCLGSAIHSCYSSLAPHGRVPVTSRLPGLVASGNMPWDTWLRQRASVCPGIYLYVYTAANIYIYISIVISTKYLIS